MRRFFIALGALALAAIPIGYVLLKAPVIEVKPIRRKNPTSFLFHASFDEVCKTVEQTVLSESPISRWVARPWHVQIEPTPVGDLSLPRIIVLNTHHDPFCKSAVYFSRGEPLDYLASFRLRLTKRSENESEVQVETILPEVINGKSFGFGSCGPGFANRYVPVEPTTIEEYEILLRIGEALGEKGMPAIVLPP